MISGYSSRLQGITLIEVLVVIFIAGIIVSIAAPSYFSMIQDKRYLQAETLLLDLIMRQENYFSDNLTYTTDLNKIGYDSSSATIENEVYFRISARRCSQQPLIECVELVAAPLVNGDHYLTVTSISNEVVHSISNP